MFSKRVVFVFVGFAVKEIMKIKCCFVALNVELKKVKKMQNEEKTCHSGFKNKKFPAN
jgi:hypothetical protein